MGIFGGALWRLALKWLLMNHYPLFVYLFEIVLYPYIPRFTLVPSTVILNL
jgi:hypothetical protein